MFYYDDNKKDNYIMKYKINGRQCRDGNKNIKLLKNNIILNKNLSPLYIRDILVKNTELKNQTSLLKSIFYLGYYICIGNYTETLNIQKPLKNPTYTKSNITFNIKKLKNYINKFNYMHKRLINVRLKSNDSYKNLFQAYCFWNKLYESIKNNPSYIFLNNDIKKLVVKTYNICTGYDYMNYYLLYRDKYNTI